MPVLSTATRAEAEQAGWSSK